MRACVGVVSQQHARAPWSFSRVWHACTTNALPDACVCSRLLFSYPRSNRVLKDAVYTAAVSSGYLPEGTLARDCLLFGAMGDLLPCAMCH